MNINKLDSTDIEDYYAGLDDVALDSSTSTYADDEGEGGMSGVRTPSSICEDEYTDSHENVDRKQNGDT